MKSVEEALLEYSVKVCKVAKLLSIFKVVDVNAAIQGRLVLSPLVPPEHQITLGFGQKGNEEEEIKAFLASNILKELKRGAIWRPNPLNIGICGSTYWKNGILFH